MRYITLIASSDKTRKVYINQFKPLGVFNGKYSAMFEAYNVLDNDVRGTNGTATKVYDSYEKAIAAGKRYIKKYE